jgi:transcription elongation factor GreB
MSRGFVREDDQEEPVFIPPRAALPPGMENHVTPRGLQLLQEEREELEAARNGVQGSDEVARRRELAEINGKLDLLNARIASAHLVPASDKPLKTVRFGATVTFRIVKGPQEGTERTFTLVGVDEASVADGKIAFIAPIAQALLGKRVGGVAKFRLGPAVQELKVLAIA